MEKVFEKVETLETYQPPGAPPTSTPTLYIHVRGEKNQREGFIAFYDTEPPPSPNLSREG